MSPDQADVFELLSRDHEEIRRALAALAKLGSSAAGAEGRRGEIISSGLEHMAEEEEIWPLLRRAVGPEEARRLGREVSKTRTQGERAASAGERAPAAGQTAESAAAALAKLRKAAIECGDS
ncbi:MAG TPA: hemerythrin domain-containing protein [Streptosporangiaceae bacterium]|jgi:hypothetical protein